MGWKKAAPLFAVLAASCIAPLVPGPGIWNEVDNIRRGKLLGREFGIVRLLVREPEFQKGSVRVFFWVEPNTRGDPLELDTEKIVLVEPGGHVCRNEAKAEKRMMSSVAEEGFIGQFSPGNLQRTESEGFRVRLEVVRYSPFAGRPIPLEFGFQRE